MEDEIMSREEALERLERLKKPLDLEKLTAEGVLEKKGTWYRIVDPERLPEHALSKVSGMKETEKGTLVKFWR